MQKTNFSVTSAAGICFYIVASAVTWFLDWLGKCKLSVVNHFESCAWLNDATACLTWISIDALDFYQKPNFQISVQI